MPVDPVFFIDMKHQEAVGATFYVFCAFSNMCINTLLFVFSLLKNSVEVIC